jgi:predicted RNA-binding protein with PIN domain
VARTAWPDLAPEEERRRTVALLEELQARSGGPVVVVFDGDDAAVAPVASRSVRVRFSATGVTADDHIAELVADLPPGQPVVVVSSDKEVAAEGRRLGAVVLSSSELLAAVGR